MSENSWKDIILPEYEVRKSNDQKTRFIDMLRGKFGDRLHVEDSRGLTKSRNIVIGDPERAKVVFTAHYDTCAVMPFPNFITPKNIPVYILYQLLITAIIYIPLILIVGTSLYLTRDLSEGMRTLVNEIVLFSSLFGIMYLLLNGPANRHTANDNTSGVVAVLTLADRMNSGDCAFILFDNEEKGMRGSAAYAKAHPNVKKNGLIVNLDCISDGDYVLILTSKKAEGGAFAKSVADSAEVTLAEFGKHALLSQTRGTVYPSDQASFKKHIAIAALKKSRCRIIGYYMDKIHTKHDTQFDENNITAICTLLENAVNSLT